MSEQEQEQEQGKPSIKGVSRSLDGFEEIAIAKAFGKECFDLSATAMARALLFALRRRDGMKDFDAFQAVMKMPLGEVNDSFAEGEAAQDAAGKALTETPPTPTS